MTDTQGPPGDEDRRDRELLLYETVLDDLDDAVYALDPDGDIVYVNQRYAEMKGVDAGTLVGTHIYDWVTDEAAERARAALEEIAAGERDVGVVEYDFLTADGDRFPAELRFKRVTSGDIELGRVGVIRDVSERKEREDALRRKNEQLESFASVVSHDLRNPLNVLSGSLELARETGDGDHLERAERAVEDMTTLVDDLLMLAREGAVIDETEPVDLASIAESAWETATDGSNASVSIETTSRVVADPDRLTQLLENLLRNAVDHAGDDVAVTVDDLEDGFRVADDGPGIPANVRDRAFESDYSTAADGTGFGLAIVAEIADAHGWSVSVDDAADGGAAIEIRGVERAPGE
ncbi:two-component system sensor histidine kinase NtrB [Halobaculum rubrum]|uniref:two-component system sensor histidine kinase NtrB n=1 Tax=Halobaculum rubrum TaxID=2872158 RepID=UPI001CA3AB3A|nr:PAS domain-containing sensor histidine kinase [Halobaculum rubrum]QZX99363.1 PAS domain-containing sensor histidine kinase [Halobaculum rubrum]